MLNSTRVREAFDISKEPAWLREKYGRTTYGQGCLLARRLAEAGVKLTTVLLRAQYRRPQDQTMAAGGTRTASTTRACIRSSRPITCRVTDETLADAIGGSRPARNVG